MKNQPENANKVTKHTKKQLILVIYCYRNQATENPLLRKWTNENGTTRAFGGLGDSLLPASEYDEDPEDDVAIEIELQLNKEKEAPSLRQQQWIHHQHQRMSNQRRHSRRRDN